MTVLLDTEACGTESFDAILRWDGIGTHQQVVRDIDHLANNQLHNDYTKAVSWTRYSARPNLKASPRTLIE